MKKKFSLRYLLVLACGLCCTPTVEAQTDTAANSRSKIVGFPIIAKTIETGWSIGLAGSYTFKSKAYPQQRTSNVQLLGLYSFRKQLVTAITGTQYFNNEQIICNEQISFSSFPDKFWGIGNKTSADYENYSFKQFYVQLHPQLKVGKRWFIGVPFELQDLMQVKYNANGLFDAQNVLGRNGYHILGLGTSITFDSRNHAFYPTKGTYAQVYFNHFDDYLGSNYTYSNLVIDTRKFITIGKDQILAMQGYFFNNFGNQIPLRSLASFGGSTTMRGYYSGRYRDKNQMVIQAEYRRPLWQSIGIVFFAGMGDVAPAINKYRLNDFKYAYGTGLRLPINRSEKLHLRIDYGFGSKGNSGLYFQLGEAF